MQNIHILFLLFNDTEYFISKRMMSQKPHGKICLWILLIAINVHYGTVILEQRAPGGSDT